MYYLEEVGRLLKEFYLSHAAKILGLKTNGGKIIARKKRNNIRKSRYRSKV